MLALARVTLIVLTAAGAGAVTVTVTDALTVPTAAAMVAVPAPLAVTRPPETVATVASDVVLATSGTPRGQCPRLPLEVRVFAVERAGPPDRLHHVCAELLGDVARRVLWLHVRGSRQRDLHQLMRAERIIDGLQQRGREALMPHMNDRTQMMRLGPERSTLARGQRHRLPPCVTRNNGYGLMGSPSQKRPSGAMRIT